MKSRWTETLLKKTALWRGNRLCLPAQGIRVRILLAITLGIVLVLLGVRIRSQARENLAMAHLVRHGKVMRTESMRKGNQLQRIAGFLVTTADTSAIEKVKTEQMESLVRRLRSRDLEIISFQAERKKMNSGVVIELNISLSGAFPDLVGALDEIGTGRPAWMAHGYRIRLIGRDRIRMDGIFHLLVNKRD